jgi:hypothetical protein
LTKARPLWLLPATIIALAIATGIPLAWSRDFGAFVLATFFYLPALAVVCIALPVSAIFIKNRKYRIAALTSPLAIAAPLTALFLVNVYEHDHVDFALWYPAHRNLVAEFSNRDGIILNWDDWGMAGDDNFAYLVSAPGDTITDSASASRWVRSQHLSCPVASVQRMIHSIYIFTTYNCPLQ